MYVGAQRQRSRVKTRFSKERAQRIRSAIYSVDPLEQRLLLSTFQTVASFIPSIGGVNPSSPLVMDGAGNLFGESSSGGTTGDGELFEIAAGSSTVSVRAIFDNANGQNPQGGLFIDSHGNLFGTTEAGGAHNNGTIFEVAAGSSTITTLASFNTATTGQTPMGGVVMDSHGNLFGTTNQPSGVGDFGSIFELPAGSTTILTLPSFDGVTTGAFPTTGVVIDKNGDLFGTTSENGGLWELTAGASAPHLVSALPGNQYSNLTMDASGDIYGVSGNGGSSSAGALYELPAGGTAVNVLASFSTSGPGDPVGPVAIDGAGNVYGTSAEFNGSSNTGTIFEYNQSTSSLNTLTQFTGANGADPLGGVIRDGSGDLFGTTSLGGTENLGTAFELVSGASTATTLASFNQDGGADPLSDVVVEGNGDAFGVTNGGGSADLGTVYEITAGGSLPTTIASFTGANGSKPQSQLVLDSAGDLFGTTTAGGASGFGTVFEVVSGSTTITTLASFDGMNGSDPGQLIMDGNGNLFGATTFGFSNNLGGIFEVAKGSSAITPLAAFTTASGYGSPHALYLDGSGDLIGGAASGGASSFGTIFELAKGSSTVTPLISFDGTDGTAPSTGLIADAQGNLYGATHYGGTGFDGAYVSGSGTVFEIPAGTTTIDTLYDFTDDIDGAMPYENGNLAVDSSGNVYGTAEDVNGKLGGLVFEIPKGGGSEMSLVTFTGPNGNVPVSGIVLDSHGNLWGTASVGGLSNSGTVFEILTAPAQSATHLVFDQQPTQTTAGLAINPSVTVEVEDASGQVVTADDSTVTLTLASGPGTLGGTVSEQASGGIATFDNLILTTAGQYSFNAADGALTGAKSNSFSVVAAAASQLVFIGEPSGGVAGAAISAVDVSVEDQFNNLVTGDTSQVTISLNSGPGSLSGTTSATVSSGVAKFTNLIFSQGGTYSLSATDGGLTSAVSTSFNISAAAATKLVIVQQPTGGTAGVALAPNFAVDVEDAQGDVVAGDSSNVSFTILTGPAGAGLSGTTTQAASSGVAMFAGLSLNRSGTYTLQATDGKLSSAITQDINIAAGPASQLVIVRQPTGGTVGTALSPNFVVDVEDGFGDIVAGDFSGVSLSILSGPTGATLGGTATQAASAGVATLSGLSLDKAGTYTLQATDGKLTAATTQNISINASAAAKLVFTTEPSGGTAGTTLPAFAVSVEDSSGDVLSGDTSTVTLSINSGTGSLAGTASIAASNGVATFNNVSISPAGSFTLKATDGDLSAVSTSFSIAAAAASKLVIVQQPTSGAAGTALSPSFEVDVEDAFGDIIAGDFSNVSFAIFSGPAGATLSGTATQAASAGTATFADLTLDKSGAYTLKATDGTLASATTQTINISPAAASQLAFTTEPTGGVAGATLPAAAVTVEDQFGNVVSDDTSTISLAVNTGPGTLSGTTSTGASSGVATFNNFALSTAGGYTLIATDGKLASATSASFNITTQTTTPQPPVATGEQIATPVNTAVTIDELADVTDPNSGAKLEPATVAIVTGPTNGSASVNAQTGSILYTPATGYTGADAITFNVKDSLGMTSNNATITVNVTAANTRTLTMDGWLITFAPSDMMSRDNGAGLAVSESSVYTSTSPSVVTFTQESYNASSIISIVSESLTNVTQSTFTGVSKTIDQVTPGNGGGAVFSGQSFNLGTAADTVFTTQTVTSSNATYDGGELLYLGTTLLGQPPLGGHLVIDANPATSGTMEVFTLTQTPIIAGQGAPTLITQSAPSLVTQTIPVVSTPVSSTVLLQAALAAPTQTNLAPAGSTATSAAPSIVLTQTAPAVSTPVAADTSPQDSAPVSTYIALAISTPASSTLSSPEISASTPTQSAPAQTVDVAAAADRVADSGASSPSISLTVPTSTLLH